MITNRIDSTPHCLRYTSNSAIVGVPVLLLLTVLVTSKRTDCAVTAAKAWDLLAPILVPKASARQLPPSQYCRLYPVMRLIASLITIVSNGRGAPKSSASQAPAVSPLALFQ